MNGKRRYLLDKISKLLGYPPPIFNPKFSESYTFYNNSNGFENLLLILAGFQPFYWDRLCERINKCLIDTEGGIDVCVCIPKGVDGALEKLKTIADKYGWSLLYIKDDLLAQVQNTAISLFPKAHWILKIDEDIVVSDNFFDRLKATYHRAEDECIFEVGFVGATINLNAVGVKHFLTTVDKWNDFESRYGKIHFNRLSVNSIHDSAEMATFIWEHSIPFDDVAYHVSTKNAGAPLIISPIRYSIGVMFFTRDFWESIGGFQVGESGSLGVEEEQVNLYCQNNMLSIVIAPDVLAGHLGFYRQKEACRLFFETHTEQF